MANLPARTAAQAVRRAGRRRLSRDERLGYLILLPALGAVFAIVTIPFVLVIAQSISTDDGTIVGLRNYSRALANPLLYEAIRATGIYTLIVLPIEFVLGLSFAVLVHRTVRRPGLLIVFFRLADVLRVFDHVFILTGGGPGTTTQLLSLYMYRVEFKFFDTAQAAALAVMVLVSFSLLYALIARVLPLERA